MPCVPNARLWLGYERVSQLEVLITQAERVAASYTSQKKLLFCGVYQDPDLCIHSVIFHPSSLCSSLCFYLHPFASTSIPLLQPPSLCFYLHLFASISIPLLLPPPLCFNLHTGNFFLMLLAENDTATVLRTARHLLSAGDVRRLGALPCGVHICSCKEKPLLSAGDVTRLGALLSGVHICTCRRNIEERR